MWKAIHIAYLNLTLRNLFSIAFVCFQFSFSIEHRKLVWQNVDPLLEFFLETIYLSENTKKMIPKSRDANVM